MHNHPAGIVRRERFVSNTAALAAYTVIGTAMALIQIKLLSHFLTKESFGLFASLRGFSILIAMISANGIPALLVRFLPVHESSSDSRSALRLGVFSLAAAMILLAVSILVVQILRPYLLGFVPGEMLTPRLMFWFYLATLGIAAKLVLYGGLNGLRRITHQVVLETASIFAVLLWIYVQREHLDIEMLFKIFGTVAFATVVAGIPVWFSFLSFSGKASSSQLAEKSPAEGYPVQYRAYWTGAVGLSLVAVAFSDFDRYLLSQIISLEVLALFHIGSRIMRLANRLLTVPNLAFQPEITRLHQEGAEQKIVFATRMLLKFNTALALFIMLSIIAFSKEIIMLVSTKEYTSVLPLLVILCVSLPLTTLTAPITSVMKALDQIRGALYCDLAWAAVYILLLFVLGMSFGIIGIGVAHVCACLAQLWFALRISKLQVKPGFIMHLLSKLMVCGIAAFLPFLVLEVTCGLGIDTVLFYVLKGVFYVVSLYVFHKTVNILGLFDQEEKASLLDLFAKRGLGFLSRLIS